MDHYHHDSLHCGYHHPSVSEIQLAKVELDLLETRFRNHLENTEEDGGASSPSSTGNVLSYASSHLQNTQVAKSYFDTSKEALAQSMELAKLYHQHLQKENLPSTTTPVPVSLNPYGQAQVQGQPLQHQPNPNQPANQHLHALLMNLAAAAGLTTSTPQPTAGTSTTGSADGVAMNYLSQNTPNPAAISIVPPGQGILHQPQQQKLPFLQVGIPDGMYIPTPTVQQPSVQQQAALYVAQQQVSAPLQGPTISSLWPTKPVQVPVQAMASTMVSAPAPDASKKM